MVRTSNWFAQNTIVRVFYDLPRVLMLKFDAIITAQSYVKEFDCLQNEERKRKKVTAYICGGFHIQKDYGTNPFVNDNSIKIPVDISGIRNIIITDGNIFGRASANKWRILNSGESLPYKWEILNSEGAINSSLLFFYMGVWSDYCRMTNIKIYSVSDR